MTLEPTHFPILGELLKAIHFSASKHRDQRRKNVGKTPYINHPLDVAYLLWFEGGVRDKDTLIAAILHDTVEDTTTTFEEIEAHFGLQVRHIVAEVTDDKGLEWTERKTQQVEKAASLSPKAKLVMLGDKICNLRDVLEDPPENWSQARQEAYFAWAQKVIHGIRGTHPTLETIFDSIQKAFQHRYNPTT